MVSFWGIINKEGIRSYHIENIRNDQRHKLSCQIFLQKYVIASYCTTNNTEWFSRETDM